MMNRNFRNRVTALSLLIALTFLLSSCMFSVKLSDGRVGLVSVSQQEIMRFVDQMERCTANLLRETREYGEPGLARIVTEMRVIHTELTRKMSADPNSYIDLGKLELKLKAFELQMGYRFSAAPNSPGVRSIKTHYEKVKYELNRFRNLIERSVH